MTPYDDRFRPLDPILSLLGTNLIVSSKETSVGTRMFTLEVKFLALIMYSNLYPLINIISINIGRARFLYDLITRAPIDICAHIFQTLGKTAGKSAAKTYLPFCSLIMKILLLKGVHAPQIGIVITHPGPITYQSLKSSKNQSSVERAKKSSTRTPKNEVKSLVLATIGGQSTAAPGSSRQAETEAPNPQNSEPHTPYPQLPSQSSIPQLDRIVTMMGDMNDHNSRLSNVMYANNNQVQARLTAIEIQLDAIQLKFD